MSAAESLRAGDLDGALRQLQDDVRREPGKAEHRTFLFQLLCVLGQWERALKQLQVVAELDPEAMSMAQTYREAIRCEALRAQVFAGQRAPTLMGEPPGWVALMVEALRVAAEGQPAEAQALRAEAFEAAPASAGSLGEEPFEWIADADTRLGPIFEAIVNGRYYWIPFSSLAQVKVDQAADLRDVVWMPGWVTLQNGGELAALLPTRYPGSESAADGLIRLARKTEWVETKAGDYHGLGQRLFATDAGERPLMDVRLISISAAAGAAAAPAEQASPDA
jgi:type VI secretion system protein ImpE